ncbi:MAG: 4Fe-4S binding protein [Bacilli bacterium]|nr:4Fe-4S binding protein [Bacilli bacterium]MBN2877971.1 4Fe-4S binding protein [Bacilli bacterium]
MENSTFKNYVFSPNGETKKIADYFSSELNLDVIDLTEEDIREQITEERGDLCILFLPVYSQNIPRLVRNMLSKFQFRFYIFNITYGGFSYGNVLQKLKKLLPFGSVIGYSITPVKHAYINQKIKIELAQYNPLIERIKKHDFAPIVLPRRLSIYPIMLEQCLTDYNYRLKLDADKCTHCGLCIEHCPTNQIKEGIILPKSCLKCSKCVQICPTGAILGKTSLPVRLYFQKKQKTSVIIR